MDYVQNLANSSTNCYELEHQINRVKKGLFDKRSDESTTKNIGTLDINNELNYSASCQENYYESKNSSESSESIIIQSHVPIPTGYSNDNAEKTIHPDIACLLEEYDYEYKNRRLTEKKETQDKKKRSQKPKILIDENEEVKFDPPENLRKLETIHAKLFDRNNGNSKNDFDKKKTIYVHVGIGGFARVEELPPSSPRISMSETNSTFKTGKFGDDAGFYVDKKDFFIAAVADGAGGNRAYGHDPKIFSETLMRECHRQSQSIHFKIGDYKHIIFDALQIVQDKNVFGSCTICFVAFDKVKRLLHVINIGDTTCIVWRNGKVAHSSCVQLHNEDCPNQLTVYPWTEENWGREILNSGELGELSDVFHTFQIKLNDVILLGSDGVFGNLSLKELTDIVGKTPSKNLSSKTTARLVAEECFNKRKKVDDILCICCRFTHLT
ncbi:hypothetical protein SNEBB_002596 [Seison nebaliae]|nr:hypothetical protein SNEBB_002596 [Seison nebaliae]